jgi:hypothetical protein
MSKTCSECCWYSDGYQGSPAGFCYSECDYVDPDGTCAFYQESLREEIINHAPQTTPVNWRGEEVK